MDKTIYVTKQFYKIDNNLISDTSLVGKVNIEIPAGQTRYRYIGIDTKKPPRYDKFPYPKIINNRVKLERQFGITYKYKGKEYTFKTPVMQEDYEAQYDSQMYGVADGW